MKQYLVTFKQVVENQVEAVVEADSEEEAEEIF
jgi:hypothetical protein